MIQVKFFARLRDQLGQADLQLAYDNFANAAAVKAALVKLHPQWQDTLTGDNILIAVNQTMGNSNSRVKDGDEVAFFPPVTGG